ncbi:MAG: CBS domain-containing protein [Thiobacillaceae bacterium]|jgi:CBS-domain-containing membrane protein|nr:CBS domain-containing protein [Thiobacillaceae bacterium]
MSRAYKTLPVLPLQKGAGFVRPRQAVPDRVGLDDPALSVMTDFALITAHTTSPMENIEAARARMIHQGVRMLLVVDEQNSILGLVTSTDLTSEKPMQIIRSQGIRHSDVLVKDIMTPREKLEVICLDDLQNAVVGDIVATLQAQGRQHALAVERQADRSQVLRGLFSASQIGKQLGTPIHTMAVARTFAEIGAQLSD